MEHLELRKKITIMLAIMAAMLFAALNQTIVGTSLPRIIADIGGMDYFSWVFTIYMLASCTTAILVGKLSDIYGRKPFILIGLGIFMVATFLNGTANDIVSLIIFRGFQGFGGGMIFSTAFASVGDLFPPRERGRWQGLMSATFGLASVFGPTLGGYIVDNWHWQWIFWIFLPFGFVAFILIWKLFPSVEQKEKEPVDYFGSVFLIFTIIPLLLAFSWAGNQYEWTSWQILGLFSASIAAFIGFVVIEKKVKSPVLPLDLFKNKIFTLSNVIGLLIGMAMFGAIMYMPFFVQGVIGTSATSTGFIIMSMMLSMVVTSIIIGQIVTKTGKYKKMAIVGLFVMGIGIFSLSTMDVTSSNFSAVWRLIIIGSGLGISFPIFTLTVQNAVDHKLLGVATSSVQLFRQLGGTIGVSIMGSIMNVLMTDRLAEVSRDMPPVSNELKVLQSPQVLMDPEKLQQIQAGLSENGLEIFDKMLTAMREALSYGLSGAFVFGAVLMVISVVLVFFLDEIPLRTTNQDSDEKKVDQKRTHQATQLKNSTT
jgi:EmrB/QacA subfamily drug resistance transporter